MAAENVKAFFEALSKDEALQQALKEKEVAYTGSKEDREAIIEGILIPVAKEAGYTFTMEELEEFEKDMCTDRELDEDELEAIAGGVYASCIIIGISDTDIAFAQGNQKIVRDYNEYGISTDRIESGALACWFIGVGLGWTE